MTPVPQRRQHLKWAAIALICVVPIIIVGALRPVPQSQSYHHFADSRQLLGLPNAFDVLSNLPFIAVGLLGLIFTLRSTLEASQRWAYAILFAGLLLTGFGSSYYHLAPDNHRLVADRLPMTVAMAGFITALLCDRFGPRVLWTLPLLLGVGIGSVVHWNISEQQGHGDLRWYGLYQGLAILFGTAVLLLFPSRASNTREFTIAVIGNIAAKLFELLDKPIFALGGVVSGHTLKHLSAGLSFVPLVLFVYRMVPRGRNQAVRGKSA
jgi:Ceramidase